MCQFSDCLIHTPASLNNIRRIINQLPEGFDLVFNGLGFDNWRENSKLPSSLAYFLLFIATYNNNKQTPWSNSSIFHKHSVEIVKIYLHDFF